MKQEQHSDLFEWLSIIPPLPWQSDGDSLVIDRRGLIMLSAGHPHQSNLKLGELAAISEYAAHACTQLPRLIIAADAFLTMAEALPATVTHETLREVWDQFHDAIRDAKGQHTRLVPEEDLAESFAEAQLEILRLQGQMTEIHAAAKRFLDTAEKKGVFGEEAKNLLASIAGTTKPTPPDPLTSFINTVAGTGGVVRNADGTYSPMVDPEWLDLADCYLAACAAKGVKPLIAEQVEHPIPEAEANKGEA